MLVDGGYMGLGTVALMLVEAVVGILLVELYHQTISRHLRDDRGGGDREAASIALDDGALWQRDIWQMDGIEEQGLGRGRELL